MSVFARGVPGITHETFTSEAAVRALMTCERLFEVDDEEKSPQRRKRVSLLPNKLLRRHSLDFRRALDAWDQLVARGYVLHVDPRHLSLDGERELKNKDAVNNSTHFRFEPSRFAPFFTMCVGQSRFTTVDNCLLRRDRRLPDVGLRAHPRRRPSGRGGARGRNTTRASIPPFRTSGTTPTRRLHQF